MDSLRVLSLAVVIAFHWLGIVPTLNRGIYTDQTVTTLVPGLWPLTWVGDVVPLFFFVGGFANATSYESGLRRGESGFRFVRRRYSRILLPTLTLIGIWVGADAVASALGLVHSPTAILNVRNTAPLGPLWFVGAYLVQIALVPLTIRAHRRFRTKAPAAIFAAVACCDFSAWAFNTSIPLIANFALVWMVPHQLGYFYADGTLASWSRRRLLAMAAAGLGAMALLTSLPIYPRGLLNPHWQALTINAVTLPLAFATLWIVAAASLLIRPLLLRLPERHPTSAALIAKANRHILTLFLWHATAYLLAVLLLQRVRGVMATEATLYWWQARPIVFIASAVILGILLTAVVNLQRFAVRHHRPG
jgi:uncharacterized integral membrane protein